MAPWRLADPQGCMEKVSEPDSAKAVHAHHDRDRVALNVGHPNHVNAYPSVIGAYGIARLAGQAAGEAVAVRSPGRIGPVRRSDEVLPVLAWFVVGCKENVPPLLV